MRKTGRTISLPAFLALAAAFFALFSLFFNPRTALAEPAEPYPFISEITAQPKEVQPGDLLELSVRLVDEVTEATGTMTAYFMSPDKKDFVTLHLTRGSDGVFQGTVEAGAYWQEGSWTISHLEVQMPHAEIRAVNDQTNFPGMENAEDLSGGSFLMTNPDADTALPTIESISLDRTKAYLGDTVTVTVQASDEGSGVKAPVVIRYLDGGGVLQWLDLADQGAGRHTGTISIDADSRPGKWQLATIAVADNAGNFGTYATNPNTGVGQIALDLSAGDFTAYTYVAGDVTPPQITLSLNKTQVVSPAQVVMTLKVSDPSGIAGRIYGIYKAPDYATNTFHRTVMSEFSKRADGVYEASFGVSALGTWVFDHISVTDRAGNTAQLQNRRTSAYGTGDDLDYLNVVTGFQGHFNSMGGSSVPIQFTATGYLKEPAAPTKEGFYFSGWYTGENGQGTRWNFTQSQLTDSRYLYAYWVSTPDQVVTPVYPYFGTTTGTALNMRGGPSTWYKPIATIPYGSIIVVKSKDGNWFLVNHQGQVGYVSSSYVVKPAQESIHQVKSNVNFRTGPSSAYPVIKKLTLGTYVQVIAKPSATWWQIMVNGTKGYVSAAYLTGTAPETTPPPVTTDNWYIVTTAMNFRTGPSTGYSIIRKLSSGTPLKLITKVDANWLKVSADGQNGYVSAKYAEPVVYPLAKYITFDPVNMRTGPSTTYSIITRLEAKTVATLIKKTSSTWYKVLANGKVGYVSAKYLNFMP